MPAAPPFMIRDYQERDYAGVERVWQETGMAAARRGDTAAVIERTLRAGGRLLVMIEPGTGQIIGTSWLTTDGRRLYLHHFGIRPGFQGRGLSKPLLAETLRVCRKIGLQVKLEVHRQNSRAIAIYTRAGFRFLGDYDVYIMRDIAGN